jgi:hypothetical protein
MRTSVAALLVTLGLSACSGETPWLNQRPVAHAGVDLFVLVGETAGLDGSGSYDPDGDDLDFFWELVARPAGSRAVVTALPGGRAELTPDRDGVFLVRLVVSDGELISQPDLVQVRGQGRPCISDADCDDQDVCTGEETCGSNGRCRSGTPLDCDDQEFCTQDGCDPESGCTHTNKTGPCDDGDPCTMNDQCVSGECTGEDVDADGDGHQPEACGGGDCDDANENINPDVFEGPQGADVCGDGIDNDCDGLTDDDDPACSQCTQDSDCDDGAFCNGAETCDSDGVTPGTCQSGTPPCTDGVDCTVDSCDEATDTCGHTPDDSLCDDGAVCNGAEWCDDQNGCQAGSNAPHGTPCDDQNPCTQGDYCDGGGNCIPGPTATEGPVCDAGMTCHDGIDNDCDGATDGADENCQTQNHICIYGPSDPVSTGGSGALTAVLDAPGYDPSQIVCYTDTGRLLAGEVLFQNDFESNLDGFTISDASRVYRRSDAQNPASSGSNGVFIFENGAPGWMQTERIDTTGRTRILLRYASRSVETEDNQDLEFFITEYSPDDGASWYVLDIQGDGFNHYYFQWFSHILPASCENNPNLRIRFRQLRGSTVNEGGHVDDFQVIDLPEPTVQWTMLQNRFEAAEGNTAADVCEGETVVHFGTQSPQQKVCLRQDAQNPSSADAANTQGLRLSGEETWIQADGWSMWDVPPGSDLVAAFFMDDVNMPETGYANAWYLYGGIWRRMNGVGVDTTVEPATRFMFVWDPATIGDWVDTRFWIPWSVDNVTDSHHVVVDDFDLTWYRASHDVIGPFTDRGDGTYTAGITSDLVGTASVTCIYYGNDPPLFTDGIWPSSGPWPVQFQ